MKRNLERTLLLILFSFCLVSCNNKSDDTAILDSEVELLNEKETFLKEKEEYLKERESELDQLEAELIEKQQKSEQISEIANDSGNEEIILEEESVITENFFEEWNIEEYEVPNQNYGIRNVPIYEGVANYAPDMFLPITVDISVYTTPRGSNKVEKIGGRYTVDYGTTVLEALDTAFGIVAENGKITEIGGYKASDLGYEEFYAQWTSVSRVTEVNMSGYIIEPDDSIAIFTR